MLSLSLSLEGALERDVGLHRRPDISSHFTTCINIDGIRGVWSEPRKLNLKAQFRHLSSLGLLPRSLPASLPDHLFVITLSGVGSEHQLVQANAKATAPMTKGDASPARVYTPLLDKKSRPNLGHVAALNVAAANAASMQAQQRDVTHVDIHRPLPLQHDVAEEGAEFGDDALTVSFSTRMAQVMSPSHGSCGSQLAAGDMCEHCNAPVALRQQLHDALCARDAAHAILARKDAQLAQAGAENARLHEQVTRSSAQVEQLSKRLDSMNEHGKWSNDFPTACRDSPRTLTWHSRSLNPQQWRQRTSSDSWPLTPSNNACSTS